MKSIKTLFATATLFTAMYINPAATVIAIISILVIADIQQATQSTTPSTRADDASAWDAIFEEPDADEPDTEAFNDIFAIEEEEVCEEPVEEPCFLTYKELKAALKSKYTASQRKKLGIKLNAKRSVLEAWL